MPSQPPPRRYVALLALIAGLILLVGAKFRPKAIAEASLSPAEVRRLQILTQRRNLENLTSYFTGIADDANSAVVWLRGMEMSGVVWNGEGLVIGACPRRLTDRTITAGTAVLEPEVLSEVFPVAAMRAPRQTSLRPAARSPVETLTPGSWIVQVAAKPDGGYYHAPGNFGGLAADDCGDFRVWTVKTNLPLGESALGGGLFDMDGKLLGVVLRCGDVYSAVAPEGVDKILTAAQGLAGQVLRRYGFRAEPLDEQARKYFHTDRGLLVTEVWTGRRAAAAGLAPGDIIQALDDTEVHRLDDLTRLTLPVAYSEFDLWVWRAGKTLHVKVPAIGSETAALDGNGQGISLAGPPSGFLIEEIAPGSRAARASLRPGDRLLSIAGRRPESVAAAQTVLSDQQAGPVFATVQRGPRCIGVFLR